MAYRVRLYDRFDQLISSKEFDTPSEAGRWAAQAWDHLLSERVGPPAEGEPESVRQELTFVDSDVERPATEAENAELSEAMADQASEGSG
jgi:hypothetical protein